MKLKVLGAIAAALAVLAISSVALAIYPGQSIGQGSSDIWVMNLDETLDADVVASYINQDGVAESSVGGAIAPLGNARFPASSSGLADGWLGSMVLFSNRELASVAELHWQNVPTGDGWSGAAYIGYSEGANEIFLSGLAKTSSHRSIITIQCVDTVDCEVSMTYRGVDGIIVPGSPFTEIIEADSQETYDLHDPTVNPNIPTGLPTSWFGAMRATSDQKIAGVITTHWVFGYAVASNGLVPGTDTTIYFTSLNRRNFTGDWKGQSDWSGFTVQNLNDFSIDVYNSLYGTSGGPALLVFSDTIPAYASHNYNLRYGNDVDASTFDVLGNTFLGTATVTSTDPIVGAASGVRYPSQGMGGAYLGVPGGTDRLVFPVAYRVKNGSTWLNESALAVQNVNSTSEVTVTVSLMHSNGTVGVQFDDTIPAASVHAYNTRYGGDTPLGAATFDPLGDSWAGTIIVTTENPTDEVTGVLTNQTAGSGYVYMAVYNAVMTP